MKLAYSAYDRAGQLVRDVIDARDEAEANDQLRRDGLFVTDISGADGDAKAAGGAVAEGGHRVKMGTRRRLRNVAMFTRQLHVLSSTGTPMVEALGALKRQSRDDQWKIVIDDLISKVEEGLPLSAAMGEHPESFDSVFRSLVAAGESGGQFEAMLDRLATLVNKQQKTRSTVIGALTYPALLLVVSLAVLVGMLLFVLPRFTGLFKTLHMSLPPTTEALVMLSNAIQSWWWLALLIMGGSIVGITTWLRCESGKVWLDTMLIRLPQVGAVMRSFVTARIARLLGVLMQSQVPLLEALSLTKAAAGNVHYERLIERAEEAVQRGEPISSAFADESLISPSVYEAIRSGESTGQIGPLLLSLADFMDEENETILRSLTSILEPVILVVLGALVALVALSMFLPLFDLTAQAGAVK